MSGSSKGGAEWILSAKSGEKREFRDTTVVVQKRQNELIGSTYMY